MAYSTSLKEDDPEMRDRVGLQTGSELRKALVLVKDPGAAASLIEKLTEAGFIAETSNDPIRGLHECRANKPEIVVVDENLPTMSGIHFISDLLKISWTTATILVSERDDNVIHEATEGLGILGHINDYEDLATLEDLLKKFDEVMSCSIRPL
jgi:DNA-binding NarL/FixJ family response regulator